MNAILEQTRKRFETEAAKQAEQRAGQIAEARKVVIAIAEETAKPADVEKVLKTLQGLGAGFPWLEEAVRRCKLRLEQHEALERAGDLRKELTKLDAKLEKLTQARKDAAQKRDQLYETIKLAPRRDGRVHPVDMEFGWRYGTTREQVEAFRSANLAFVKASDDRYFAHLEAEALRAEIRELESIDSSIIDTNHAKPHDFRLPDFSQPSA